MLSYSAFIIIPVLLIGYIANTVFVQSIREQTRSNIQGTLQQMMDNIEYQMDDIERISDMFYYDDSFISQLRNFDDGYVNYETTKNVVIPKFRAAMNSTDLAIWLSFYTRNDSAPEVYNEYGGLDPLQVRARPYDWYHTNRIEDKAWYRHYPEERYGVTMQWARVETDGLHGRISLLRRVVGFNSALQLEEVGFLRISARLSDLLGSVDYQKIGDGTTIFISDDRNKVVLSSGHQPMHAGREWTAADASDDLVIQQTLDGLGWKLTALVPKNITDRETNKIRLVTIAICIGCFVIFSVAGLFVSRFFAKRVLKVVHVLESFREGDFHRRMNYRGRDEFHQIAVALNEMGEKTDRLIQEVYLTNLRKTEAELESLQAQINPHFLYNTLSSISRLAKFGQVDKLHQMVRNLASFYRLSLNEGRKIIPVHKELEQAQAYLEIEKAKHGDRLSIQFDASVDVYRYNTIKLVLQPFIENVLKHAWCGDRIHVRVTAEKIGDTIRFQIIDDGVGFQPKKLREALQADGAEGAGYGIRNVDERIKLYYGRRYGISIFSKPGIGTTVSIAIPCLERKIG